MADAFSDALTDLLDRCPGVAGAAFTDLDGEDIAHLGDRESLQIGAVYAGIALRRLSSAEQRAGRGGVNSMVVHGDRGAIVAVSVGDQYQLLVALEEGTPSGRVIAATAPTVAAQEEQI